MTIQDLINVLGEHKLILVIWFCAMPLLSFLAVLFQGGRDCRESRIRYFYSVLIYLSCIPGIFAAVLTAYAMFFLRANLLRLNVLVYFLPIISMVITLLIIRRKNSFDHIPGFERILGLMLMMGVSFVVSFLVYRTVFFIGFFGGFGSLLLVAFLVFILLKVAAAKMMKK